ncbi:MAG: nitrile hydratase subunit alpha, partial [Chloroflexota bacterium]
MGHDHHHHHTSADAEIRAKALEALLVEKGLIITDVIDEVVRQYEEDIGPMNGARVVARAWTDPDYKKWLLEDG